MRGFYDNIILLVLAMSGIGSASESAAATCAVPNTIANGQIADASKLMDNFNAVADCANVRSSVGVQNSLQVSNGSGGLDSIAPLTEHQLLIGKTGDKPQPVVLTAGPNVAITYGTNSITIGATGSGAGSTLPSIRSSAMQAASGSNIAVSWPSGTVSGDLAVIFIGGTWEMSAPPSGWHVLDNQVGGWWNGAVIAKVLTDVDISSGSVSINFAGADGSVVSIITFQGGTTGLSRVVSMRNGPGGTVRTISAPPNISGSKYLFFGSGRTAHPISISAGTVVQTAVNSGATPGSGSLYVSDQPAFFSTVDFDYTGSVGTTDGDYEAALAVTGP